MRKPYEYGDGYYEKDPVKRAQLRKESMKKAVTREQLIELGTSRNKNNPQGWADLILLCRKIIKDA